jgi:TAT-translocated FGD2 family F420-dependent dehydrogenase
MASIGFVLSNEQFPPTRLVELGVLAEQAGFDRIWTSDHFHPWMHNQGHAGQAWILLAALGQRLQRISMGTGVTCPSYRYHPAIVAQAFATLGAMYPGRVFLGVGSGEAVNEQAATGQWGDYQERADRLAEAVTLIRRLWTGDWVKHQGRYYQTAEAHLYELPQMPVPIYIAAEGPKSMYLAGQYGDGLITDSKSALMPEMRDSFRKGAQAAGKDPDLMPIHAESFVFVGRKEDAEDAANRWRFVPKSWDKYVNNPDPREIWKQSQQDVSLDEAMKDWVVGGDPEVHIKAIHKLVAGGVTHIYIHSGQESQERVIEFYGREVLPHVYRESIGENAAKRQ